MAVVMAKPTVEGAGVSSNGREYTSEEKMLAYLLNKRFGDQVWDDSAIETARRVLKYWDEMAAHIKGPAFDVPGEVVLPFDFKVFPAEGSQMVLVGDIEFSSCCVHHMLPIIGVVHIAYIPNQLVCGLSKIPRLVEFWASRPQVQEKLTSQIAKDLKERLKPMGVMVVIEANHSCMQCRGIKAHNGMMKTSLPLGVFLSNPAARSEFFNLLCSHRGERS